MKNIAVIPEGAFIVVNHHAEATLLGCLMALEEIDE